MNKHAIAVAICLVFQPAVTFAAVIEPEDRPRTTAESTVTRPERSVPKKPAPARDAKTAYKNARQIIDPEDRRRATAETTVTLPERSVPARAFDRKAHEVPPRRIVQPQDNPRRFILPEREPRRVIEPQDRSLEPAPSVVFSTPKLLGQAREPQLETEAASERRRPTTFRNQKFSGMDYRNFAAGSAAECQTACSIESQCRAWTLRPAQRNRTYDNGDDGPICYLKTGVPPREYARGYVAGVKPPPPAVGRAVPPPPVVSR